MTHRIFYCHLNCGGAPSAKEKYSFITVCMFFKVSIVACCQIFNSKVGELWKIWWSCSLSAGCSRRHFLHNVHWTCESKSLWRCVRTNIRVCVVSCMLAYLPSVQLLLKVEFLVCSMYCKGLLVYKVRTLLSHPTYAFYYVSGYMFVHRIWLYVTVSAT